MRALRIAYRYASARIRCKIGRIGKICKISDISFRSRTCKVRFTVLTVLKLLGRIFQISEIVYSIVCLSVVVQSKSVSCKTESDAASEDLLIGILVRLVCLKEVDGLIILCVDSITLIDCQFLDIDLLSLCEVACLYFCASVTVEQRSQGALGGSLEQSDLCAELIAVVLLIRVDLSARSHPLAHIALLHRILYRIGVISGKIGVEVGFVVVLVLYLHNDIVIFVSLDSCRL